MQEFQEILEPKIDQKSVNASEPAFGIKWDFSAPKLYKHSKRARDLLRIIELGFSEYRELIEIPPLDEYSSYMLRFGQRDRNQVQTQTNEDMMQKETQTNLLGPSSFVTSWTQSPPDDEGAYAGHECDKPSTMQAAKGDDDDALQRMFDSIVSESFPDLSTRSQSGDGLQAGDLSSLCESLNMVLTLLEEEAEADRTGHVTRQHQSNPNSEVPSAVGLVQGSLGHLSLSLAPSPASAAALANPPTSVDRMPNQFTGRGSAFSIPDHCYRDMSDLECVRRILVLSMHRNTVCTHAT
uniref:WD repeat-containing protein 60 n=2 Tax=Schistocephalus solidus TaxID=70667 RepID=A0A0X3NUR8_SCHSO